MKHIVSANSLIFQIEFVMTEMTATLLKTNVMTSKMTATFTQNKCNDFTITNFQLRVQSLHNL